MHQIRMPGNCSFEAFSKLRKSPNIEVETNKGYKIFLDTDIYQRRKRFRTIDRDKEQMKGFVDEYLEPENKNLCRPVSLVKNKLEKTDFSAKEYEKDLNPRKRNKNANNNKNDNHGNSFCSVNVNNPSNIVSSPNIKIHSKMIDCNNCRKIGLIFGPDINLPIPFDFRDFCITKNLLILVGRLLTIIDKKRSTYEYLDYEKYAVDKENDMIFIIKNQIFYIFRREKDDLQYREINESMVYLEKEDEFDLSDPKGLDLW
ncbi:hypothetical protein EQH57_0172 [Dictyocoela roeselum]|nr:hypothetical protein EQH57_0172 [Dictyocoela roeselum]